MKPSADNADKNGTDRVKSSNRITDNGQFIDEATDFLGSNHGNAMPEEETAIDKTLNPEDNSHLKSKPGSAEKSSGTDLPSIH